VHLSGRPLLSGRDSSHPPLAALMDRPPIYRARSVRTSTTACLFLEASRENGLFSWVLRGHTACVHVWHNRRSVYGRAP
jgi:hypothetical protein